MFPLSSLFQWPYTGELPSTNEIARFSPNGTQLPEIVTDVVLPTDIAFDGISGALIVAENGPAQQIFVYALPTEDRVAPPPGSITLARTAELGAPGGVLAGPSPGVVAPSAFAYLTGVGVAPDGGVIVASVGYTQNKLCSGLDLRKLSVQPSLAALATAHRTAGLGTLPTLDEQDTPVLTPVWNMLGLEWVDSGAAAPVWGHASSFDEVVFTEQERFVVNYSRPQGEQWAYVGYTIDPVRFGTSDARLQQASTSGRGGGGGMTPGDALRDFAES